MSVLLNFDQRPSLSCSTLFLLLDSFPSPFATVPPPTCVLGVVTDDKIWYSANIPVELPTHHEMFDACSKAPYRLYGACISVAGKPRFWVKFCHAAVIISEARTQAYVAKIVNSNPASVVCIPDVYLIFARKHQAHIVVDFVQGTTLEQRKTTEGYLYDKNELDAVAAAFH